MNPPRIGIVAAEPSADLLAAGLTGGGTSKVIDRFVDAMSVKARYGPEYYADPASTEVGLTPRELVAKSVVDQQLQSGQTTAVPLQ